MAKWVVSGEPVRGTTHLIVSGPTRHESVGAWVVASARSAGPTRHDYFLFYKNSYIHMYNLY
jgi:hypothetical protein